MEHAKVVSLILERKRMVNNATEIHVTKGQSSKLMEHASNAHHIPVHPKMATFVCQTIAMHNRNSLRMEHAKNVKSLQENKVMVKLVHLINVTIDRRSLKIVYRLI